MIKLKITKRRTPVACVVPVTSVAPVTSRSSQESPSGPGLRRQRPDPGRRRGPRTPLRPRRDLNPSRGQTGQKSAGRRAPGKRGGRRKARFPGSSQGDFLAEELVEVALLDALNEGLDVSSGVEQGGAVGVAGVAHRDPAVGQ